MKVFLGMMIFMNSAFAVFPIIDIQRMSGNYLDEGGTAYAEKAYYVLPNVKISHADITTTFNKKERSLIIRDPSTTVELEFDFSFLNVFKAISFDYLNAKSTAKLFTITSDSFDVYIAPKKYHLEKLFLETDVRNIPTQDDEDITIVDGLVLNGALTVERLNFEKFDDIVFDDLRRENPKSIDAVTVLEKKAQKINIPMIIRRTKFNIQNGVFVGSALIDSYINLWLRLGGKITTDKKNTYLDIYLTKAKLGIFSFRGTLLQIVKRLKLDNVTVKKGHIIVTLEAN